MRDWRETARAKIASRVNTLLRLDELLNDAEVAELLRESILEAVNGTTPTPAPTVGPTKSAPSLGVNLINGEGPTGAVRSILPRMRGRAFTHHDVLKELYDAGFVFDAKNHAVATSGVLRRLADWGEIAKVDGKIGRRGATLYRLDEQEDSAKEGQSERSQLPL
jgi:hypothetical protein